VALIFSFSIAQSRNLATLQHNQPCTQRNNHATLQHYNHETLQRNNHATLQHNNTALTSYILVVHTLRVAENEILQLDLPAKRH
jgi:hypothetical protein